MTKKPNLIPPALRHAGYSATNILPGENAAEFEKLHRDLIVEFEPSGVFENEIIATLARLIWRKNNLATFRIAGLARSRCKEIEYEKVPQDKIEYPDFPMLGGGTVIERVDPAVREAAMRVATAQARKELGEAYGLIEIGEAATVDHLMRDLEIEERLNGLIDRCIKRLLLVRGLKSISLSSSTAPSQSHIKKLSAA
jgi:hypothetical protein